MGIREMETRAREDLLGKRHDGLPKWLSWRLPVWLRVLVVVAAGAGVLAGAQWTTGAYRETVAYRQAADCRTGGGGAGSCIGREDARVADKAEVEGCSGSGSDRRCTTKHKLRLSGARRTEWLDVAGDTYDAAFRGSRAELQTWQGAIVGITVRGHTQTFPPPSEDSLWMWIAAVWLLLGLALWAGLSGLLSALVQPVSGGWAIFTLPLVLLLGNVLFGAGVGKWLLTVVLTLGVVGFTIGARRQELRKKRRWATANP